MNKENRKNKEKERVTKERESRTRKRIEREEKTQSLGNHLLDHESSVEVGYGFHAIRSKLLIANDMY